MTTVQQAGGASAVDFAAFGDYGDFRRKRPQPATGEFVRPAYHVPRTQPVSQPSPESRTSQSVRWNRHRDRQQPERVIDRNSATRRPDHV